MRYTPKDFKPIPSNLEELFKRFEKGYEPLFSVFPNLYTHDEMFDYVKDKNYFFTSFFVVVLPLKEELLENPKYAIKTEEVIVSRLEEELNEMWYEKNNLMNDKLDELKEKKRSEGSTKKEGELIDECVAELMKELEPEAIERAKLDCQMLYEDDWKKEFKKIREPRVRYNYERVWNVPMPWKDYGLGDCWGQTYVMLDEKQRPHISIGTSSSSGLRKTHARLGHLFARIQNEKQNIPSHVLVYTDENEFKHVASFETLTLDSLCITSNYNITLKESEELLRNIKKINWSVSSFEKEFYIEVD